MPAFGVGDSWCRVLLCDCRFSTQDLTVGHLFAATVEAQVAEHQRWTLEADCRLIQWIQQRTEGCVPCCTLRRTSLRQVVRLSVHQADPKTYGQAHYVGAMTWWWVCDMRLRPHGVNTYLSLGLGQPLDVPWEKLDPSAPAAGGGAGPACDTALQQLLGVAGFCIPAPPGWPSPTAVVQARHALLMTLNR